MQVLIKYLLEKHTQIYVFVFDFCYIQETNHRKESFAYTINS